MPLNTILIRMGRDDDVESRRFLAAILLLFAFGLTCSLAIWQVPGLAQGDSSNIASLMALGTETLCLTTMAAALMRRNTRRQLLGILSGLVLLSGSAANVWDYCVPDSSVEFDFLGHTFDNEQRPIAAFIPYMLSSEAWLRALPILTILIASARKGSLHWRRLATSLCAGLVIEFSLTGGPKEFMLPQGGAADWIRYAVLITAIAATICLITHWRIRWGALTVLVATMSYGIWSIVNEWNSVDMHISNQLKFQWDAVLSMPSFVGPFFVIVWYAWREPMIEFLDDGSPWPRRYCSNCFYNLHGLETDRCPECGLVFEAITAQG